MPAAQESSSAALPRADRTRFARDRFVPVPEVLLDPVLFVDPLDDAGLVDDPYPRAIDDSPHPERGVLRGNPFADLVVLLPDVGLVFPFGQIEFPLIGHIVAPLPGMGRLMHQCGCGMAVREPRFDRYGACIGVEIAKRSQDLDASLLDGHGGIREILSFEGV